MAASLDLQLAAPEHPEGVANTRSSEKRFAEAASASLHLELLRVKASSAGSETPVRMVDEAQGQRNGVHPRLHFAPSCGRPAASCFPRAQPTAPSAPFPSPRKTRNRLYGSQGAVPFPSPSLTQAVLSPSGAKFTGYGAPVSNPCNRAQGENLPGSFTASARFHGNKPICRAASVPAPQASPAVLVSVSQRTASLTAPTHDASLGGPGEWAKQGVSLVISRSTSLPQQSCMPVKSSLKKTMSLGPGSGGPSLRTVTFKESVSVRRFKHRMDTPGMIVPVLDITSQF